MSVFDMLLRSDPLPSWLDTALTRSLNSAGFPATLGQTIGISDPHCTGAGRYALALAHVLLCDSPVKNSSHQTSLAGRACGACSQCALLKVGNHPDLMCLVPEAMQADFVPEKEKKPSKGIKVEQLRAMENNFVLSSQRGGRKVVIIYPAQTLGVVPANALLKTLEEPPPNTFFIVVSQDWGQVLPTIRSRCIVQTLAQPSLNEKITWLESQRIAHPKRWLELAAGRVDLALDMAQDPLWMPLLKLIPYLLQGARSDALGLANDMSKAELKRVTQALSLWLLDLLAVRQGAQARFFAAHTEQLKLCAARMDVFRATQWGAKLDTLARLAEHPLSARTQCEALLLEYQSLFD